MRAKDAVGSYGEQVAVRHLQDAGYAILDRNWRHGRGGEIDIVATRGGVVVFVEVKCRRSSVYGTPAEAVTSAKAARIRELAACWLAERAAAGVDVRFDVVAVVRARSGRARVEHLEGAF